MAFLAEGIEDVGQHRQEEEPREKTGIWLESSRQNALKAAASYNHDNHRNRDFLRMLTLPINLTAVCGAFESRKVKQHTMKSKSIKQFL